MGQHVGQNLSGPRMMNPMMQQQFNPMAAMMNMSNQMQGAGIDPSMLANMMQQITMNPQAVQNLIDPSDPKSQLFFNGIQNMANQFNGAPPQMPLPPARLR